MARNQSIEQMQQAQTMGQNDPSLRDAFYASLSGQGPSPGDEGPADAEIEIGGSGAPSQQGEGYLRSILGM